MQLRSAATILSGGPIKLAVPVSQAYTSVSFYTRNEVAYYAINDRSAGRKVIELDLMTEAQHAALPEDEEVTAADRLIIDSPTRRPDRDEGARARARPDAASAGFARGLKLQGADRAAGQAGGSAAGEALTRDRKPEGECSLGRMNVGADFNFQTARAVIARSEATKQSSFLLCRPKLDCFAALAMTVKHKFAISRRAAPEL